MQVNLSDSVQDGNSKQGAPTSSVWSPGIGTKHNVTMDPNSPTSKKTDAAGTVELTRSSQMRSQEGELQEVNYGSDAIEHLANLMYDGNFTDFQNIIQSVHSDDLIDGLMKFLEKVERYGPHDKSDNGKLDLEKKLGAAYKKLAPLKNAVSARVKIIDLVVDLMATGDAQTIERIRINRNFDSKVLDDACRVKYGKWEEKLDNLKEKKFIPLQ